MNHVLPTCALDVRHMKWCPSGDRVGKNFLKSRKVFRFGWGTRTNVHVDRGTIPRSSLKDLKDLPVCRSRRIGWTKSDRQCATTQSLFYPGLDLFEFLSTGRTMCGLTARQKVPGIVHDGHPHSNVTGTDSIVD